MKSCRRRLVFDEAILCNDEELPAYKFYTDSLVKYDEHYSYFVRLDVKVVITAQFDEIRLVNTFYTTPDIKFVDDHKTDIELAIMKGLRNASQKTISRLPPKLCVSVNVYKKK